jgi:hypothetical protein
MTGQNAFRMVAALGLSLALAGCGEEEAEIARIAKEQGLGQAETAAFAACAKDMRRNKPMFPVAQGNMRMNEVPLEICACQARTMTVVFKDDQYKSHTAFAEYMAKETKKKKPRISKKDLKPELKAEDARRKLAASLETCVDRYRDTHKEEAAELFELVPVKEKKKKKADGETQS